MCSDAGVDKRSMRTRKRNKLINQQGPGSPSVYLYLSHKPSVIEGSCLTLPVGIISSLAKLCQGSVASFLVPAALPGGTVPLVMPLHCRDASKPTSQLAQNVQ